MDRTADLQRSVHNLVRHHFVPTQVCLQDEVLEVGLLSGRMCVSFLWLLSHKRVAQDSTECILSQLWGSEVQNQFHQAKIKVLAGQIPSAGSRKIISLPFSASGGHLSSLACGPFLHFQRTLISALSAHRLLLSDLLPPSYKDPCDYIKPTWIT